MGSDEFPTMYPNPEMYFTHKHNFSLSVLKMLHCYLAVVSVITLILATADHSVSFELPDQAIIFAINEEIGVPGWGINSSDYCLWSGIHCSPNLTVEKLHLSYNGLRGNLTLISNLTSLKSLDLSNNNFYGPIPTSFGNLSELEFLDLSANKFKESVPPELGKLKNLKSLNLSDNYLVGGIPEELKDLSELRELQLSGNSLNGSIPLWIGNLTSLRVFTAYENALGGEIPGNLGSVSELRILNVHSNQLEGLIPNSLFANGKLEALVITQNRLNGSIPESIGNCKDLSSIRLGNNMLVGGIPSSVGNISSLTYFEANNNNLSGEVTAEFSRCSNLTLLNLAFNGFTGLIPSGFGQLENLQELIVSDNSLNGEIPNSILSCKSLNKLDLSNNRLNGSIPKGVCSMPRLQFLILDQNSIGGEIPSRIGDCVKLLELQLGSNRLKGIIPTEIGHLRNLQIALNVSFNNLHGSLPVDLGKLDKLVALDVSNNQLTGTIPLALKGMLSLIEVNLSNNQLTGRVPTFIPFQKSPSSSFLGNKGLCGDPLSSSCEGAYGSDDDDLGSYPHKASYRIALAVIGSGLAVFVSVIVVVVLFMMRERQEKSAKDAGIEDDVAKEPPPIIAGSVFIDNLRQAIDFNAVVKSTFKDSNKLSSGTFSDLYKATMPSGLALLIRSLKSMDRNIVIHQNRIIRELERLSRISHDHLLKPIGFVIYEDVALLLHEYMANGNLFQYLHDPSKQPDWKRRLSIATGVAEGLAFLHSVAVIHLDISSGNVLLDANFRPLVAEIEISKLLDPARGTASISAVAGSFGYIPPEYAFTMQVTAPGNVYSYGVILLEMLTSRLPVEEEFGEGADLVKWVHGAPMRGETPEQILDAKLSTVSFAWRKEMLSALKVALLCTDSTPAKRPKMKKVVELLSEIN